jgi:hypothetical protein
MPDDREQASVSLEGPSSKGSQARAAKVEAFLTLARERFRTVVSVEAKLREDMLDDLRFRASDQWSEEALKDREEQGKPTLVINRIPQFIRQVLNSVRLSDLAVKVRPVDEGDDVAKADILQGLIRHIEDQSDASVAYTTAAEHQIGMGRGWWRILAEYEDERSFVQSLKIKRVRNPFSVYMDPAAVEVDGSDARYAFVTEDIPLDEFKERFGEGAAAIHDGTFQGAGDSSISDWFPGGKVRVAEYYYVQTVRDDLHLIRWPDTGVEQAVFGSELRKLIAELKKAPPGLIRALPETIQKRSVERCTVRQALITGVDILEGNDDRTEGRGWPGKWIPIIPVLGDEIDLNGRVDLRGMTRDAKDAQRAYNHAVSTLPEIANLLPRSPWIMAEGQDEGHEEQWAQANRRAYSSLKYKPVTIGGQLAPPPQRTPIGADLGPVAAIIQQADNDLKTTMGLFEPSLGMRSAAQSGRAIVALQQQGETANSNFADNLMRAIRATGRILIDLIPHFYDVPRVVRIRGTDDSDHTVMVHAGNAPPLPMDEQGQPVLPKGVEGIYDLSVGKYDVTVSAGASTKTRKEEAFKVLSEFIRVYPAAFPILGDLLVKALDWPDAQAASERLKRSIPPEIRGEKEEPGEAPAIPPEVQQQMQQLMQQLEQMGVELEEAKRIIQSKQLEIEAQAELKNAELASRERIAEMQAQLGQLKAQAAIEGQEAVTRLKGQIAHLEQKLQHAHERGMLHEEVALKAGMQRPDIQP